jgi:hypothetical protein
MKKFSLIYRWIIISVLVQVMALSYVEFIYLPNRGTIKATMYDMSEDNLKGKAISLPSAAKDVQVSFNGLFAAYRLDGKIDVLDIKSRKTVRTLSSDKGEFSYYRWLPDRNMLIYSEKAPDGQKGQVRISTYDVSADIERNYSKITGLADNSEVVDIELSPLTNVVYFMIKTGTASTRIYKYDIMDNLKSVMSAGIDTRLKEASYDDILIYQKANSKIYAKNGKTGKAFSITPQKGAVLLNIDSGDNVYAGKADGSGNIKAVYFGKTDEDVSSWKKTDLLAAASPSDIFITPSGSIYVADRNQHMISNADGSNSKKFSGELIEILDDYMVSLDGSKLWLTVLK